MISRNQREGVFVGRSFREYNRVRLRPKYVLSLWSFLNHPDNRKFRKEMHITTKLFSILGKQYPNRKIK